PNKSQVLLMSLLLGFILPVIAIVLLDFFNNKIQDKKEIEEATGAPVIGELSFDRQSLSPIVHFKSRSVIAEQLRLIRTNFKYIGGERKIKTILVTSFMSGEGKSFVSINLAATFSTSEAKVLLLELDLRKPKFSKYLNVEPPYGLTDLIVSHQHYSKAVISSAHLPNVDIITSGNIPPNPHELLISKRLKEVIYELQQ